MLLAALQDVAGVMHNETEAADKIAVDTVKLPPGIFKAAVDAKRLTLIVQRHGKARPPASRSAI